MLKPVALVILSLIALSGCGRAPSVGASVATRAQTEAAPSKPSPVAFGTVAGIVVDEAGDPVEGAIAQLEPAVAEVAPVDAAGRFSIDRVPAGTYRLTVSAAGLCDTSLTIQVGKAADAKLSARLVLKAGDCRI